MLTRFWRWLVGSRTLATPCVIETELDGQRIRYEAPTVAEVRELASGVGLTPHSEYVDRS